MSTLQPRYSKEEFARRGEEIYDRNIRPQVCHEDQEKYVAIDIESGQYAMDRDAYMATERLLQQRPDAQIWLVQVGEKAACRIGASSARGAEE